MKKLITLLIICACTCSVFAEPDSHRDAARDLLSLVASKSMFKDAFTTVFNPQLKAFAEMGMEQDKIDLIEQAAMEFADAVANDPEFDERMISIYTEAFTEDEIRELIAFYQTPIGKKSITVLPQLFEKGAAVGQEIALKHQDAFQKKLETILSEDEDSADE